MSSSSFFRDLLDTIVDRGRSLSALSLSNGSTGEIERLCRDLLSRRGESSGVLIAQQVLTIFAGLDEEQRTVFFRFLLEAFGPDEETIRLNAQSYLDQPSPDSLRELIDSAASPRQELFRRLNLAPGGTGGLVQMRARLLEALRQEPELKPLDTDLVHLFGSWFNRGFLVMQRIDWQTRANILEKIIEYEAVHEIQGWDDLKRRLDPADRRCFGFFHPSLVDEPLIFVEVALMRTMPETIHEVLSEEPKEDDTAVTTAVFYSISNCQAGLAGISFGNFLIKQVVNDLAAEFPGLKTFVTLSPVPGFRAWLAQQEATGELSDTLDTISRDGWHADEEQAARVRPVLEGQMARYLLQARDRRGRAADPVARFHLGNGARLERINWLADLSPRGLQQSAGMMVNYLYNPRDIERNHEAFAEQGKIIASQAVRRMLRS